MNAQAKEQIMAAAIEFDDAELRRLSAKYLRRRDREAWATLDAWQRSEYRKEAFHLRRALGISPWQAVRVVRRMVRIGAWK